MEGKRLCTEEEWTFGLRGEEALPLPVRLTIATRTRASSTNRGGGSIPAPLMAAAKDAIIHELDRLWQGVPAGLAAEVQKARSVSTI